MRVFGIMLLIVGMLLLLTSSILDDISSGTEIRFGYIQNGEYKITNQQTIGQDTNGLLKAKLFQGLGVGSLAIGSVITACSFFLKKVSDGN